MNTALSSALVPSHRAPARFARARRPRSPSARPGADGPAGPAAPARLPRRATASSPRRTPGRGFRPGPTSLTSGSGDSGRKSSAFTPFRQDVHPVRVYPERHSVVAEGGRDGEHRVGAREGPAFCLRGKLAESGGPIGRLLEGLRRVQFYDQWSVKLAGQKDANGRVQRDPLVDDVRTVVIELALGPLPTPGRAGCGATLQAASSRCQGFR